MNVEQPSSKGGGKGPDLRKELILAFAQSLKEGSMYLVPNIKRLTWSSKRRVWVSGRGYPYRCLIMYSAAVGSSSSMQKVFSFFS